jgi:flagellar hook-basal body complex protein FliE
VTDPIAPISAAIRGIAPVGQGAIAPDGPGFVETLKGLVSEVEQAQRTAEEAAKTYATGRTTDVTSTMIAMEQASVTFALMLQVRNRLLDAYQEISRLQV